MLQRFKDQQNKFFPQLFERNWSSVPSHQASVAEARWRAPDHCLHAVSLITSWPVKAESSDPFRIFFFSPSARLHRLREASAACLGTRARRDDDYFDTLRGQCSCWHQWLQPWHCLRSWPTIFIVITRWIVSPVLRLICAVHYCALGKGCNYSRCVRFHFTHQASFATTLFFPSCSSFLFNCKQPLLLFFSAVDTVDVTSLCLCNKHIITSRRSGSYILDIIFYGAEQSNLGKTIHLYLLATGVARRGIICFI